MGRGTQWNAERSLSYEQTSKRSTDVHQVPPNPNLSTGIMSKDTQKGSKGRRRRRVQVESYGNAVPGMKTVQFGRSVRVRSGYDGVDDAAGKCEQKMAANQEISILIVGGAKSVGLGHQR